MNIVRGGTFYYPSSRRYSSGVMCDICRDMELVSCIGCHTYDLCLPCCHNLICTEREERRDESDTVDPVTDIDRSRDHLLKHQLQEAIFHYSSCVECSRCNKVVHGHMGLPTSPEPVELCLECCVDIIGKHLTEQRQCRVCNFTGRCYIGDDLVCDFCKMPPAHMAYAESGQLRRSDRSIPDEITIVRREIVAPCSMLSTGMEKLAKADLIHTITLLSTGGIKYEMFSGIRPAGLGLGLIVESQEDNM